MAKKTVKPIADVPSTCDAIRELQRQRVCNLKSRIMIENRLTATVATSTGYHAGMEEKERTARFNEAAKVIARVRDDREHETDEHVAPLILATSGAIDGFDVQVKAYEKEMEKLAKQLPVAVWLAEPEQRGFGMLSLAKIVGECGDLNNYAAPGKLWRRMGCAPFESKGKMRMPSTWRGSKPSLTAAEWEECGYSPRRRSVAYLIGDGLVKQNAGGPYRARYDDVKLGCQTKHPEWDWKKCDVCKGAGCEKCYDTGRKCGHAHNHAMLLATKLLLKCLWIEWTGGDGEFETARNHAALPVCV